MSHPHCIFDRLPPTACHLPALRKKWPPGVYFAFSFHGSWQGGRTQLAIATARGCDLLGPGASIVGVIAGAGGARGRDPGLCVGDSVSSRMRSRRLIWNRSGIGHMFWTELNGQHPNRLSDTADVERDAPPGLKRIYRTSAMLFK